MYLGDSLKQLAADGQSLQWNPSLHVGKPADSLLWLKETCWDQGTATLYQRQPRPAGKVMHAILCCQGLEGDACKGIRWSEAKMLPGREAIWALILQMFARSQWTEPLNGQWGQQEWN